MIESHVADRRIIRLTQDRKSETPIFWPNTFPYFNENFMPLLAGDYVTFIGASGEGKSTFARWLARHFATIAEKTTDEYTLYASVEEYLEKVHAGTAFTPYPFKDIVKGQGDILKVREIAADNLGLRVNYLAPSYYHEEGEPTEITFDVIKKELMSKRYNSAILDYIQICKPFAGYRGERLQQVMEMSIAVQNFVKFEFKRPFIALAQSNREVKGNQRKVPTLYDAQWSSQIGQDSDINFGFWNISRDLPLGSMFKINIKNLEYTLPVLKGMAILTVNKWRDCDEAVGVSLLVGTNYKGRYGEVYEMDEEWVASLQEDEVKRYIKMGYNNINNFQVLHKKWEKND